MADYTVLICAILAASALTGCGVALITWAWPVQRRRSAVPIDTLCEPRVFNFRDGYLTSPERGTAFLLPHPINRMTAWDDLSKALSALVPDTASAMEKLATTGKGFHLQAAFGHDDLHVIGLRDGDDLRVSLSTAAEGQAAIRVDSQILSALEAENYLLTQSHNASPSLAWVIDGDQQVIWANGPYQDEVIRCHGPEAVAAWPIPALFPDREEAPTGPMRRSLGGTAAGDKERWYDVLVCPPVDGVRHAHAQPLDRVIAAETSLRQFIGALTQAFSTLPSGLAVFDAKGALALFNPPLLDLTGLDAGWLASRPCLGETLASLRDQMKLAEPPGWREWYESAGKRSADQAAPPPWSERWTHSSGRAYQLTADVHYDGAVVLRLDEVTAETRLAQQEMAGTSTLEHVLEAFDDAIVLVTQQGIIAHTNSALRDLIGAEHGGPALLETLISALSAQYHPSPFWAELRDIAGGDEPWRAWTDTLRGEDGALLRISVSPVGDGMFALRITPQQENTVRSGHPERIFADARLSAHGLAGKIDPLKRTRAG